MLIDWNGNGQMDPMDLALSLAILEEEKRREQEMAESAVDETSGK